VVVEGGGFGNTMQASQDMAAEALRHSINVPPTFVVTLLRCVGPSIGSDVVVTVSSMHGNYIRIGITALRFQMAHEPTTEMR
jgi:hypothetical protein